MDEPLTVKRLTARVANADHYDKIYARRYYPAHLLPMYRAFMTVLPKAPSLVLDLGCGTGVLARMMTDAGMRVTGVDFSPEGLTAAQINAPTAILMCWDLRTMDDGVLPGPYDAVVMSEVLEHVQDDVGLMAKACARSSLVVCSVPNGMRIPDAAHVWAYSADGIRERFGEFGKISFVDYDRSYNRLVFTVEV